MGEVGIPVVDLSKFVSGEKEEFSNSIGKALEEFGFVAISNHGVDQELISNFYKAIEHFFSLPEDTKKQYEVVELGGERGYTSIGREHAKDIAKPDFKEYYSWGQFDDPNKAYPLNILVKEQPELIELAKNLYTTFEKTAKVILRAISIYLNLPEDFFEDKVTNGNSLLRAIHYPPLPLNVTPDSVIRAGRHEDINLITLLVGASAEGLQILGKDQKWIPIKAGSGQIVVNVGDMLQRLTNKKLVSTTHQVVLPENKELWYAPRYSIPFFTHPVKNMSLKCLDTCISAENPPKFNELSAGEYLIQRLREIGLLK